MTQQDTVTPRDSSTLQSVERASAVLEHLAACDEAQTASQVAQALDVERTAAHRLLRTLLKSGLVWSERRGHYSIGPRALAIGMSYVEQLQVRRIALPYLMELSYEYSDRPWSIVLAVFDGKDILLVERLWNPRTPLNSLIEIGGKMPVDRTAAGWAYLSQQSDDTVVEIVGGGRFGEIEPKLREARALHGLSFAHAELQPGIDALSAPILDSAGRVAAVVIVGGTDFDDQLRPDSEMSQNVLRIVHRVSGTLASRR
jgi:IclR family transcriptional regulator, acetate operon repressor